VERYNVVAECSICNKCDDGQVSYVQTVIPYFTFSDEGRWVRYEDVRQLEEQLLELMEFKNAVYNLIAEAEDTQCK